MSSLKDPELEARLEELSEDGTVYQLITDDVVYYAVEKGRHYIGVKVFVQDETWEEFSVAVGKFAEWLIDAYAVHEIEGWG